MKGNLFFYMLLSAWLGISGLVYATQELAISEEDYLALLEFQNGVGEQSADQSSDTSESPDVQEANQSDFVPAPSSQEQYQEESSQDLPQEEAQQESSIERITPVYIAPARSFDRYRQNQNASHDTMPPQPTDNSNIADERMVVSEVSTTKKIEAIENKKRLEPEVDKDKKPVKKPAKTKQKSGKKKLKKQKKQKPKEKKEKDDKTDYSTMPMA